MMANSTTLLKWAVATVSLGKHPSHTLERKFAAAAENGFQGVELVHADLLTHAEANNITSIQAAEEVRALSKKHDIKILSLNPFKNFEGNVRVPLQERLDTAKEWFDLAVAAGTNIVQMPSQFLDDAITDHDIIIPELRTLADLAAESSLTIAYEAVAFAKSNYLWQQGLEIVEAVDRPNFGLCLDSFHIHARIWGDAEAKDGKLPFADKNLDESLDEFLRVFPRDRVLYVQLSDGSRFDPPLSKCSPLYNGLEVRDSRLAWSRSSRPFPLESPGYFPVAELAKTWLVDYGWDGWVSMEGFLLETELEENGPETMAERARRSAQLLGTKIGTEIFHS